MKLFLSFARYAFLAVGLFLFSCTDPITVGADILDADRAEVGFTDTLEIEVQTLRGDSVLVLNAAAGTQLGSLLFGQLKDPFFGTNTANIIVVPRLTRNTITGNTFIRPEYAFDGTNVQLDSFVLVLPLDTLGEYSDPVGETFNYSVSTLAQPLPLNDNIYSSVQPILDTRPPLMGSFVANNNITLLHDTMNVVLPAAADTLRHLRIPLPMSTANFLFNLDTASYASDSIFQNLFPGVLLKMEQPSNSMLEVSLLRKSTRAGFYIYYTINDTTHTFYQYPYDVILNQFSNDYTGTVAAQYLSEPMADSLGFVSAMGGLQLRVDLDELSPLRGNIVNQARMDIYLRDLPGYDYDEYPPLDRFALLYRNNSGNLVTVPDFVSTDPVAAQNFFFDGILRTDPETGERFYRLNLSVHLQRMVDGDAPSTLFVQAFSRTGNAARSIIHGPNSATRPLRVQVAFTRL